MEHDKTLWTQPYTDEKYGVEQGSSCKYFQEFIKCPPPRSLKHFHKILSKNLSKMGRKRIPSYKTIQEYSAKWKWFKRAEAYDNWKRDVDDEELRNSIYNTRKKNIQNMAGRLDSQNILLKELIEHSDVPVWEKVKSAHKNSVAYHNEVSSFNDLVNEGIFKEEDVTSNPFGETFKNVETIYILDEIDYDDQEPLETDK